MSQRGADWWHDERFRAFTEHYSYCASWMQQFASPQSSDNWKRVASEARLRESEKEMEQLRQSYNAIVQRMEQLRQTMLLKQQQQRAGHSRRRRKPCYRAVVKPAAVSDEELDPGFRDFFLASHQHRLERDKDAAAAEAAERTEFSEAAPRRRPGIERDAEMRQIYGEDALRVQALEGELQLDFDKDLDRFQPVLWPALPLKIVFD